MADPRAEHRTLLLVDDEPLILEILQEALARLGVKLLTAPNGSVAFDLLKAGKPDAVLSDIHMPVMSGFELLKKTRESGFQTPFVFLTGYGDKEKAIQALRLGAFDFLEKPFKPDQLREVIDRALKLGVELRTLESEVDDHVRKSDVPADKIVKFREVQRAVIALKKAIKARRVG